jgi:hypothetical protein
LLNPVTGLQVIAKAGVHGQWPAELHSLGRHTALLELCRGRKLNHNHHLAILKEQELEPGEQLAQEQGPNKSKDLSCIS